MNPLRKLLSMGSQTAPKVIDDLAISSKALAKKGAMEADEIVGEATKRSSVIDDIMDAELVQKANRANMNPRLAALLGGAGVGAAGVAMMGGDDGGDDGGEPPVEIPYAKGMQPEEFPYDEMDAGAQAEALSMPQDIPAQGGLQEPGLREASEAMDKVFPIKEKEQPLEEDTGMDELSLLQSAQDRDAQDRFMAGMLRAGTTIGGSLAMIKPDYSGVDAIEKNVGVNEKNVKSIIDTKAKQFKLDQDKLELDTVKSLSDPTSVLSQEMRTRYSRLTGKPLPSGVSGLDLQKAGVTLGVLIGHDQNRFIQEQAQRSRIEVAKAKSLADASEKISKLDTNEQKLLEDRTKRVAGLVRNPRMTRIQTSLDAARELRLKLNEAYDGNTKILKNDAYDISATWSKALTGGVPGQTLIELTIPKTYRSDLADVINKAADGPANSYFSKPMIKHMIDQLNILERANKNNKINAINEGFSGATHILAKHPDIANSFITGMGAENEGYKFDPKTLRFTTNDADDQPKSTYSPEEEAAIEETLKRNPGATREQIINAMEKKKKASKLK